jgi:hypothetical protein
MERKGSLGCVPGSADIAPPCQIFPTHFWDTTPVWLHRRASCRAQSGIKREEKCPNERQNTELENQAPVM